MTFAPSYALLTDLGELRQLADRVISEGKPFGYDIETGYEGESREKAAVHPEENFVAGISFTNSLTWARYVPLRHDSGTNADNAAAAVIFWEMLTAAGEDGQPLGVAHHAKFELRVLARWFLRNLALHPRLGPAVIAALGYTPIRSCTMLESYAEGENRTHGLKDITVWTFGHFMTEILDLFPQGLTKAQQKSIRFNSLDQHDPKVVNYACEDALWALAHHLHRYPRVKDTFIYQVEMGVLREAACLMEDTGLDYDWGRMREGGIAGREFSGKYLAEVRRDFEEWLGRPLDPQFNFGSSQQLAWLLYGAHDKLVSRWGGGLGLAVTRKTKTGNPSTEAKTALKELSGQHPPVQKLLNYKALLKLVRDFLEKFEAKYSFAADGRAHPSLLQHGTVTGRTSKNDPNDQQCLPGTYEVLTPGGWVRLQDLADGVPVAEYLDDETIWFTVPSQVTRDQYAGEMVELRSVEGGDWQYTPNHRIVYRKRRKSRRRDAEDSPVMEMPAAQWAAELEARPPMFADGRRMLNDLKYIRAGFKDSGRFMLPRSQAFMHLAIACQAEGHRRTDGQGGTAWYDVELRSARKQAQFAQIVQACGLEFKQTSRSRRCRVPGSMVAQWLDESKNFRPETVLDLHASGLRDFVRTVLEWDGDFTRGCTYGQKNCRRQSVEVVQAAAVLCGFTTSIYERPEYDAVTVNLHDKTVKYAGAQQAARVPSPGMVYCVTVPSGMFLARNPQGKVMVTGNSPKKYKYALATGETFEHSFRDNIRAPRPGMRLWWQILLEELGAWSPAPEDDLGWYILGFDWSMIELRVMAGESGETALIEAFRRGDDLHNLTAGRMLGKPPEQVTDDERTKYGKAQPLDEPVLTPGGWRFMGDLRVGDYVVGSDGCPVKVTGVFPQGVRPVYEVRFRDGASTRSCDEHYWTVRSLRWPGRRKTVQLSEIRQTIGRSHRKQYWVDVMQPAELEQRPLLVDPYLLGLLLGDGCFRGRGITFASADDELLEAARSALEPMGLELKPGTGYSYFITGHGRHGRGSVGPLMTALRSLGLWGLDSHGKFIPGDYLLGAAANRHALLQGLLDTDGTASGAGAEYCSVSDQLADGVQQLVRSLGGTARKTRNSADGAWRVYIRLQGLELFRLKRKADRCLPRREVRQKISEVVFAGEAETQCISVAAPDGLYVTRDFVVTHNTFNFGISYGMEAKGIADRLGCPAAQAEELLAQFWAAYPRLRQWREKVVADSFRNGYVTTHFGRKVKIWEYEDAEMLSGWAARSRRSAGERTAGNAPIQGAAAGDYKKVTMVRAQRALKAAGLAGKVLLAMDIHDELEWYVRKDVAPADVIRVLRPHVEWDAGCCPDCRGWPPMVAEWHVGERWGSLIKLEILPDGDVRARGKAETAVAAPDEDPGGDDEDEAAREGMPAAWPSGGYPGNRAPAGAGALAGSNPAPPGPPPPPRPAPPPARPVPQVPRTVVVSLQRMPQQEQVQRFMSLLAGCPGPNTVIVRVPQGDIPVAGTSGLAPDSGAEVAVIFGGAITYYDLDSVDMAGLAAGLDL